MLKANVSCEITSNDGCGTVFLYRCISSSIGSSHPGKNVRNNYYRKVMEYITHANTHACTHRHTHSHTYYVCVYIYIYIYTHT